MIKNKNKKLIVSLTLAIGVTALTCGMMGIVAVENEIGKEEIVSSFGNYIEIERTGIYFINDTEWRQSFTVYNKNTKVVYEITVGENIYSIIELRTCDKEGNTVLQFYENGKIVTK